MAGLRALVVCPRYRLRRLRPSHYASVLLLMLWDVSVGLLRHWRNMEWFLLQWLFWN